MSNTKTGFRTIYSDPKEEMMILSKLQWCTFYAKL
jgi:hypothetical protein